MAGDRYRLSVRDIQDGDVFEWDGVTYQVDIRNPDDDSVVIQTNEEIHQNGINEWEVTIVATRLDDGQLVSLLVTTEPPVRTSEGDLEDGGPFVTVWR